MKERARARSARMTLSGQDIGVLPAIADIGRRRRGDGSFKVFCEVYFPQLFSLAWSADHLRVIHKIERVVKYQDTLAVAMPRGSGKTTLCLAAVIWAIVTGRHHFVFLIASADDAARNFLENIKNQLGSNRLLLADYPEAIYPIHKLEGESRRCNGQRYYGELTRIEWGKEEVVMPTIPGSPCGGAIIRVSGLTGNFRGALHVRPDGVSVRPSLVIGDDPQTDQSAKSLVQTAERLRILNGTIPGLAGPGKRTGIIVPCTVIQQDDLADQLLNRNKFPAWRGERTKMVYKWPDNQGLWEEYTKIRENSLREGLDGTEATEFYRMNREQMDKGAKVAWEARYAPDLGEISALQHAFNLRADHGEETFASEYQNEPLLPSDMAEVVTVEQVCAKANGRKRWKIPLETTMLTGFIDVHDNVLFYTVMAWKDDFTGYVVDYGTFPDQRRGFFTLHSAKRTLARLYREAGVEGAIQAGLTELVETLLAKDYQRGEGLMRIDRLLVDMGYKPEIVAAVKLKSGGATMMLAKGVGIAAGMKPISTYKRKPGWKYGHRWYIPNIAGTREFPHVCVDTNYWKTFVHNGFRESAGDPGSITIFGLNRSHELFAGHIAGAETSTVTHGQGRDVREWKIKPAKPDNHWFDCVVGCAAAASMLGAKRPGHGEVPKRRRERIKLSEVQKRKKYG